MLSVQWSSCSSCRRMHCACICRVFVLFPCVFQIRFVFCWLLSICFWCGMELGLTGNAVCHWCSALLLRASSSKATSRQGPFSLNHRLFCCARCIENQINLFCQSETENIIRLNSVYLGAAQAQDLQLRALTLLQGDERVRQRLGGSISAAPGGLSTRRV